MKLIATSTFGLEAVVSRELKALGYESHVTRPGWIAFDGDREGGDVARANLWLRAADRVLVELDRFEARDFGELFDQTFDVPWEDWIPKLAAFPVRGRSVKSALSSVPACQRIVKKAIVERLRKAHGVRTLPEKGPSIPVEVALLENEVRLVLDTTGVGLHKRGYRTTAGAAPLKETLAAGLVLLTFWRRGRPFLDPFCGTGTIAIEAALIGRNRAPGIARTFVAEKWPRWERSLWSHAREEAKGAEAPTLDEPVRASDVDADVLRLARAAAREAKVSEDIRFETRAFADVEGFGEYGAVVTNPPYGERLGESEEVRALYRSMPGVFERFPSWSFYVLTSERDFEALYGRKADKRRKLFNGPVECTYYQFFGPKPPR